MRILIAIPVFNERKYVDQVLEKVLKLHPEVLLIDDASSDGTGEMLEGRQDIQLIRHDRNMGYGQGIIDAFNYADQCGYDWVITMDCDEQHEPERILDFMQAIETDEWDIISGSRYLKAMAHNDVPPGDRRYINAKITGLVNETFGWDLTDTFCGFKAHRVSAMRQLNLTETGYAFPLQLWPQVFRAGLRVTEIPVRLIYNDATRTFGGGLDDANRRLQHYLDVFNHELTVDRSNDLELAGAQSYCCS
jgi:glycosyltransferase involved in cell wall biosynthesis